MFETFDAPAFDLSELKAYLSTNPCCDNAPNCPHANFQSDRYLHSKNNKIKNSIEMVAYEYFGKEVEIAHMYSWIFLTKQNDTINSIRHNHDLHKDKIGISGICYLTETTLGTVFVDGNKIVPKQNKWFLFNSKLYHHAEVGTVPEERIILAFDIYI